MRPVEAKGFAGDVYPNFEEERKRRRQSPPRGQYRPGVLSGCRSSGWSPGASWTP